MIKAGQYQIPFSFKLGDNIPGSYESSANKYNSHHTAYISYEVKAHINSDIEKGKWKFGVNEPIYNNL